MQEVLKSDRKCSVQLVGMKDVHKHQKENVDNLMEVLEKVHKDIFLGVEEAREQQRWYETTKKHKATQL